MKGLKTLGVRLAVVTLLFAVPTAAVAPLLTVGQHSSANTVAASMPQMISNGMGGMTSSNQTTTTAAAADLTNVHVQNGCHVWSDGSAQMPMMRLTLQAVRRSRS